MSLPSNDPAGNEGQLGLWDAISIIVGIVIGATVFHVPWLIFRETSDPWMGLTVWLVGGILALVGALCYAELATTYPGSGGDYVYLNKAFGPWAGFLFGWAQLAIVFTASIAAMAFVFAANATQIYKLTNLVDFGWSSELMYAGLAVIALSLLNILGVTLGKYTQNLLTAAKVLGLGAILVAGFLWAKSSPLEWQLATPTQEKPIGWGVLAMILVMYAYGGWNDAAFVAAEVRNRKRNIPLALALGVGAITVIYLLVNAAYIMGLGFELASSVPPARAGKDLPALLLEGPFGADAGRMMNVLVMISALGAVNGLIFTGARVYATLGNEHRLFGFLGHWKPGRGAPVLALLAQAIFTFGLILALTTETGHQTINRLLTNLAETFNWEIALDDGTWKPNEGFEALVSHAAPVFWLFFLMTGLSLFTLRDKNPGRERPFSVPLYPILPIIFCVTCMFMMYRATIYVGWRSLFAVFLVLIGFPLYWLSRATGTYRGESGD